jgi:hypothetical protein
LEINLVIEYLCPSIPGRCRKHRERLVSDRYPSIQKVEIEVADLKVAAEQL